MSKHQELLNISQNLAVLADSFESVAEFCRRLGINRQQFNKYLAAQHAPSHKVQLKIARYFMMEPQHLLLSNSEFIKFYEGLEQDIPVDFRSLPEFMQFVPVAMKSTEELRRFHGVYFRYHNSSIYKGRILRSITCIYERNAVTQFLTIERFPKQDGSGRIGYTFKYHGFCFLLGDRMFMIDFEGDQKNEMTFTTLVPQHRNPIRFLYGIVTGVAATSYRPPFSTRLMLEHVDRGMIGKKHLKQATVLLPSDLSLPLEVREYLSGKNANIIWGGEG